MKFPGNVFDERRSFFTIKSKIEQTNYAKAEAGYHCFFQIGLCFHAPVIRLVRVPPYAEKTGKPALATICEGKNLCRRQRQAQNLPRSLRFHNPREKPEPDNGWSLNTPAKGIGTVVWVPDGNG